MERANERMRGVRVRPATADEVREAERYVDEMHAELAAVTAAYRAATAPRTALDDEVMAALGMTKPRK